MAIEKTDIEEIEDEGAPAWMVTFADLMTLLLVFFVLLFAMSEVRVEHFEKVAASLHEAFLPGGESILHGSEGIPAEEIVIVPPEVMSDKSEKPEEDRKEDVTEKDWKQDIVKELQSVIVHERFGEFIVVYEQDDRVIIRIDGQAVFYPGQVNMIENALPAMDEILQLLIKYLGFSINIKGHTDNTPISSTRFPSNWELSAVRATTVLRYFIDRGISPERMTATGYADKVPLTSNDTPEGRATNRRVEFVLEKQKE